MNDDKNKGTDSTAGNGQDYLDQFVRNTPGSQQLNQKSRKFTPGGISHNHRFHAPYPVYVAKARGSKFWDVDGNEYVDLWMAHYDAILGHAPAEVLAQVQAAMSDGLHVGTAMPHEVALAELVCEMLPCAEQVRFCTSGTEATMYAVRLARGFTGRDVMLKMVGGWHGANTDLMVDVAAPEYIGPECKGLLPGVERYTRAVQFNDIEDTAKGIRDAGDDWAGIILEPAMGSGGFIPAEPDYLNFLREETRRAGAVLIFDEVITGFRLAPGGAQSVFGVTPDLTTLGKVMGGGLAIGGIAGREDIMAESAIDPSKSKRDKVVIGGGTYSCNHLSMVAGRTTLEILKSREKEIYPSIDAANDRFCKGLRETFHDVGMPVHVNQLGSLQEVHFLKESGLPVRNMAEMMENTLPEKRMELAARLRNHGVFLFHGGAISLAHANEDIDFMLGAYRTCAEEMVDGASA